MAPTTVLAFVLALVLMEFWAAFVHRNVYHGRLWFIHRSHHRKRRDGLFETNDIFVLLHAAGAMAILFTGLAAGVDWLTAAGAGVSVYGLLYALIHDGYIHQRLPLRVFDRFALFRRIRDDHLYHHTGDPHAHFGLFFWNRKPAGTGSRFRRRVNVE